MNTKIQHVFFLLYLYYKINLWQTVKLRSVRQTKHICACICGALSSGTCNCEPAFLNRDLICSKIIIKKNYVKQ